MHLAATIDLQKQPTLEAPAVLRPRALKPFYRSSGLFACSFFVLLNLTALALYYYSVTELDSAAVRAARETGKFDYRLCLKDLPMFNWALQDGYERTFDAKFHKLAADKKKPDVVLLGSSLMIFPLWFADHGDNLPDEAYYSFRSDAVDRKCAQPHEICNLALPLLSVADAERLIDTQLVGDKTPSLLIYGVGPRDFYDALIEKPESSVYFERTAGLDTFTEKWNNYFSNLSDEAAYLGNHAYFLYAKHAEIVLLAKSITKDLLHANKPAPVAALTDMGPQRNLPEYQAHYKNISVNGLDRQISFLEKLMETCSNRHIKLILLGMPLTAENRAIIPQPVYKAFNQKLEQLASANHQKFVDLNGTEFNTSDFLDSAHLNAKGAQKLVSVIASQIDSSLPAAESRRN